MNVCWLRFFRCVRMPFTGLLAAGVLGLAGCTVMVTATHPPQAAPSYALHGRSAPALRAEADKRCPHGYVVLREWQHVESADRSGNPLKWLFASAVDIAMPGVFDSAQLDVQCKPAPELSPPGSTLAVPQS